LIILIILGEDYKSLQVTITVVKGQTHLLVRRHTTATKPKLSESNKNAILRPNWGLTPRVTDRLTVKSLCEIDMCGITSMIRQKLVVYSERQPLSAIKGEDDIPKYTNGLGTNIN
jgi:hypothetical protein